MLILAIIVGTVRALLGAVQLCFLLCAILSIFAPDSTVHHFTALVVEPFVRPVRALLQKMNWLQNSPLDFSFLIAYLLVGMITIFLG